ncbi:truncated basic helix-loop-helix protein A-like isoform X2 [Miscanthus floridulus]|uniref:truncated basic helix-loop-helix protein A-like isoform X2 n=1 Tax=Miscanthus floridulus TaxID=154761 RepID=UPI0034593981
MAAAGGGGEAVQKALQSVAQSTGWTYSLLWRLCPRQGALVWAEGHYNGAIRTRKTTVHQPGGEGADEEEETTAGAGAGRAALRRSRQLKELYDSLAGEAADGGRGAGGSRDGGGAQQQVVPHRRPTAALAPEDLTETEWFYLMLAGEAFVRRVHVWLCGANKVDSKVFSRAILARSAGIQTVACIPVDDGVLEIGTTEKVEEDICLIQCARSIFMDQIGAHIMPTLSGHSTSTAPTTHINHQPFQTKMGNCIDINVQKNSHNSGDEHNNEMEDDDDRIDLLETNTGNDSSQHSPQDTNNVGLGNEQGTLNAGSSELMLIGTSERVRDGCSKQEDEEIPVLMVCQNANLAAQGEFGPWHDFLDDDLSSKYLQSSGNLDLCTY